MRRQRSPRTSTRGTPTSYYTKPRHARAGLPANCRGRSTARTFGGKMTAETESGQERPVIMIRGTLVGLGPLDRRHIPLYMRWMNDPEVTRGLGRSGPFTREMEEAWFEQA